MTRLFDNYRFNGCIKYVIKENDVVYMIILKEYLFCREKYWNFDNLKQRS